MEQLAIRVRQCSCLRRYCMQKRCNRFCLLKFQKALIVCPRHTDIDIVIPRNETVMTHRTEQRAADQIIAQPVPFAIINKTIEHPQQLLLCLALIQQPYCRHFTRQLQIIQYMLLPLFLRRQRHIIAVQTVQIMVIRRCHRQQMPFKLHVYRMQQLFALV